METDFGGSHINGQISIEIDDGEIFIKWEIGGHDEYVKSMPSWWLNV